MLTTEKKYQPAKLHHGYTRKQLKELGSKNSKFRCDSLEIAGKRREWTMEHARDVLDGWCVKTSFRYYFSWKKSYRGWLELAVNDRKMGRDVIPLP